jgi:hypothetical protein
MKPSDFAGREPRLVLEDYFSGRTRAWGLFEDRSRSVRRQFVVDIDGMWDGRVLTLDERFAYADGARERRVWRITKLGDHTYEGRADDVVGVATGVCYGNALNWRYCLRLAVHGRTLRLNFDDWMFLQADDVLINRAVVSKFGLTVGQVTIAFKKQPVAALATAYAAQTQAASTRAPSGLTVEPRVS